MTAALNIDDFKQRVGLPISAADADLVAHSYDCWPVAVKARQAGENPYKPDAVVTVKTPREVARVLEYATAHNIPVTPWALGSSVVGAPLAEKGGISLAMAGMNKLIEMDTANNTVTAEAGINAGKLEEKLNAKGMTMNFSPQSLHRSSIGGWVATRATGQFSSRYGGIEDALVALEAVLADGTILQTPQLPRMSVGPDVAQLFVGAEGTLGVVTKVTMRIYPQSETQLFATIDFPTVEGGVAAIRAMMSSGLRPFLLRFYDLEEARFAMHDEAYPSPVMFLGTDGLKAMAQCELECCVDIAKANGGTLAKEKGTEAWMSRRFDFSAIENMLAEPGGVAETIEVSHNWEGILKTHALLKERLGTVSKNVLGHFSHAYVNGVSLYMILVSDAPDLAQARADIDQLWSIAMEGALETGASIAHHHGAGKARAGYVRQALGEAHVPLQRLKTALDPKGILNPGKLGFGK